MPRPALYSAGLAMTQNKGDDVKLTNILTDIGLEEREARVYLATLELNQSTVLPIATKAGIKRTYTYDILESLQKKGLVAYVEQKGRRRYSAEDPAKLEEMLKTKLQSFRDVLPEIRTIYNRSTNKPKVRFYEGADAVKPLYEELAHTKEYASLASPDHFIDLLGDQYIHYLTKNIIKNGTRGRELFTHSYTEIFFENEYKKPLQEIRWLAPEIELDTDLLLFPGKLILISYHGTVHAIVIEGSSIIDTHKVMFDLLWAATPPGKPKIVAWSTKKGATRA